MDLAAIRAQAKGVTPAINSEGGAGGQHPAFASYTSRSISYRERRIWHSSNI
jgi:hypothetical protein